MSTKRIRTISLDDARSYAGAGTFDVDRDLLVLDDLSRLDLADVSLRFNFMLFCFCNGGEARFTINDRTYGMLGGDFLMAMGGQVFRDCETTDFSGFCVLVSRRLAQDGLAGMQYLWPYLLQVYRMPVLRLDGRERVELRETYMQLRRRLAYRGHMYRKETILQLMRTFFLDLCDFLERRAVDEPACSKHSYVIFDRFIRLLSANYKTRRSVAWYSHELCLTSKYLSELVKSVSGRTVRDWVTAMVMNEICMLLRDTDLSVKEIAETLHFPDQGLLGKYFKKVIGVSPSAYRRQ